MQSVGVNSLNINKPTFESGGVQKNAFVVESVSDQDGGEADSNEEDEGREPERKKRKVAPAKGKKGPKKGTKREEEEASIGPFQLLHKDVSKLVREGYGVDDLSSPQLLDKIAAKFPKAALGTLSMTKHQRAVRVPLLNILKILTDAQYVLPHTKNFQKAFLWARLRAVRSFIAWTVVQEVFKSVMILVHIVADPGTSTVTGSFR